MAPAKAGSALPRPFARVKPTSWHRVTSHAQASGDVKPTPRAAILRPDPLAGSRGGAMAKVRVYELAKEFGVESKAVMDELREMGEFVRSASSTIEPSVVRRLKERFAATRPDLNGARPAGQGGLGGQVPAGVGPSVPRTLPPVPPRPRPPAPRPPAPWPGNSGQNDDRDAELPPGLIRELLESWDLVARLAPDPSLAVRFLADQYRLAPFDVDRVRRVRNQCAHPGDQGWPQRYDLDMALTTARELRHRLKAEGH